MASGDTKTEHFLDVLANGSRADIPTDNCCNTKTQNYILGAVNRMISLEEEVEELQNNPDVTDIVSTYQDLTNYDKTTLTDGDVIRVLTDSTHDDESAYYRYNAATDSFGYIGTTRAYTDFVGTSGGMAGAAGLVPAPQATDADKFLKSDGTWATVSGGGGGTSNYNALTNKPSINGVTLIGNKTSSDLGVQDALVSGTNIKTINNQSILGSGNIDIQGDIAVEATARANADTNLQNQITQEAQARAAADTAINGRLAQLDTIVGNEITESTAFDFSEEEYSAGAIVNRLNVINIPLTNCTIKTITLIMNTRKALDCMIYVIKSDMTVVKSIEGTSESEGLSHTVSIDYTIPDNGTYYVGIYIDTARAITFGPAQADVQTNCYEFDPSTLIIGELTNADKRRVRASLLIEAVGENKITVLESDVDSLDGRVTALENGAEESLPAYYDEYLPGKIATLLSLDAEVGSHGDSFVFMTDYHDASNTGYSPELIKHIIENTATKMIVFGGDIINQYATKEQAYPHFADFHKRFLFSDAYYPIIGNHEYNDPGNQDTGYTGKRMTNSEAYGMNLRQKEVDSRYKWDGGYTYHVDNEAQKIRYYMIGCNPTSTIEVESRNAFFTSLESVPDNYIVVVIAHQLAAYNNGSPVYGTAGKLIADGCDAFNARTTLSANGLTHDYSSATGKVILLMQGHTHIDFDLSTTGGIHSVSTTCDSYAQQIGSLVRTAGTVTEQAFEVVHINTDTKTIKLTRIGAGVDRQFTYA